MVKQKFRINLFDLLVVILIIVAVVVGGISYGSKPDLGNKNALVVVKISNSETIKAILPQVKLAAEVYYSGTKYPVKQISYRTELDINNQAEYLYVTLEGPGNIYDGSSIFNGQRVYVNQKVEIRGDYQAQGYVTDFRYEN